MERKLALAAELIASDYIEHDPNLSVKPTFQTQLAAFRPPSGLRNIAPVISIVNGEYVLLMWDGGKNVAHWDQDLWHGSVRT